MLYFFPFISYNFNTIKRRGDLLDNHSKKLADTAILAGQIMLECNAETYRVEDTMNFILESSGFETCEAYAMATAVFVTIDDPSISNVTIVKRVKDRSTNLNKISQVNSISRNLANKDIDIHIAHDQLIELQSSPSQTISKYIGTMLMCGAFAALYNGGPIEVLVAASFAIIIPIIDIVDKKLNLGFFLTNILSLVPIVALIVMTKNYIFPNLDAGISIIGVIMPAVPGTAITNAIRDTFRGDYLSGGARVLESFVIALSVAIGVALGLILSGGYDLL